MVSLRNRVGRDLSLITATGVRQPRAIYHLIRLVRRMLMRPLPTLADARLGHYPPFSSTEGDSHDPATSHAPFDLSRPADSKLEPCGHNPTPGSRFTSTFGDFPHLSSYRFVSTDCHRWATASIHIPFDPSRPPDFNEIFVDPRGRQGGPLSLFFLYSQR